MSSHVFTQPLMPERFLIYVNTNMRRLRMCVVHIPDTPPLDEHSAFSLFAQAVPCLDGEEVKQILIIRANG